MAWEHSHIGNTCVIVDLLEGDLYTRRVITRQIARSYLLEKRLVCMSIVGTSKATCTLLQAHSL
jgi:hypothetical protein